MCSLEKSVLGKNCFFLLCFPARITTMQLTHNPLYEAVLGNNMPLCWCVFFLFFFFCLMLFVDWCWPHVPAFLIAASTWGGFVALKPSHRCLCPAPVMTGVSARQVRVCFCLSAHAYHRHFMFVHFDSFSSQKLLVVLVDPDHSNKAFFNSILE